LLLQLIDSLDLPRAGSFRHARRFWGLYDVISWSAPRGFRSSAPYF